MVADYECDANFASVWRFHRSPRSCRENSRFVMTSHYFAQSRSVVTRRGAQNAASKRATSLKSKLTIQPEKDDLASSAVVKLEEEEAKISGNVYQNHQSWKHSTPVVLQFVLSVCFSTGGGCSLRRTCLVVHLILCFFCQSSIISVYNSGMYMAPDR